MKSETTENEFREKVAGRVVVTGARERQSIAEVVVACVREAGLEFAPEPLKLPERVTIENDSLWPEDGEASLSGAEIDAMLAAARDRYNTYPRLYATAELALKRIGQFLSTPSPHRGGMLESSEADLAAAPAKGPKP